MSRSWATVPSTCPRASSPSSALHPARRPGGDAPADPRSGLGRRARCVLERRGPLRLLPAPKAPRSRPASRLRPCAASGTGSRPRADTVSMGHSERLVRTRGAGSCGHAGPGGAARRRRGTATAVMGLASLDAAVDHALRATVTAQAAGLTAETFGTDGTEATNGEDRTESPETDERPPPRRTRTCWCSTPGARSSRTHPAGPSRAFRIPRSSVAQ